MLEELVDVRDGVRVLIQVPALPVVVVLTSHASVIIIGDHFRLLVLFQQAVWDLAFIPIQDLHGDGDGDGDGGNVSGDLVYTRNEWLHMVHMVVHGPCDESHPPVVAVVLAGNPGDFEPRGELVDGKLSMFAIRAWLDDGLLLRWRFQHASLLVFESPEPIQLHSGPACQGVSVWEMVGLGGLGVRCCVGA